MYRANQPTTKSYIVTGLLFALGLGFFLGYCVNIWLDAPTGGLQQISIVPEDTAIDSDLDFSLLWQVWQIVKSSYVEQPVEDKTLFYGAVSGIAESVGDPYTHWFSPEEAASFNQDLSGEFEGIGAEIGMKEEQIVVIAPLTNSPAATAGLQPNDMIIKIDETETVNLSLDEAVKLIRGPKDTIVTLTIYRTGDADVTEVPVTRAKIEYSGVSYVEQTVSDHTIGIITMSQFNQNTAAELIQTAQKILLSKPAGLVLDLRNNPGGLLDDSILIASQFINDGVIVTEKYSNGSVKEHPSSGNGLLVDQPPLVVLINPGSASASEIVAGALQDHRRATIIGEDSFGKGSVQNYQSLPDGSSLKVTVARWFTPNGHSIDKQGIKPDILVERTVEQYRAGEDPQLEKAKSWLLDQFINQ